MKGRTFAHDKEKYRVFPRNVFTRHFPLFSEELFMFSPTYSVKPLCHKGPPRGKRDGVMRHKLERENGNWMEKLRYFVNVQSGIQRDWVNLA